MEGYSPISLLDRDTLNELLIEGNHYFVRQEMIPRLPFLEALEERLFILSHYLQEAHQHALEHLNAIPPPIARKLYNITNEQDVANLYVMANQPKGYKIFTARIDPRTWRPPPDFQEKLYQYFSKRGFMLTRETISGTPLFRKGIFLIMVKSSYGTIPTPFTDINWT